MLSVNSYDFDERTAKCERGTGSIVSDNLEELLTIQDFLSDISENTLCGIEFMPHGSDIIISARVRTISVYPEHINFDDIERIVSKITCVTIENFDDAYIIEIKYAA